YTRRTVLAWWTYCSNRTHLEAEEMFGWCAHGRLFGITVDRDESIASLTGRVRARVCDLFDHQDIPVQVLLRILRKRGFDARALFDAFPVSFDLFVPRRPEAVTLADGVAVTNLP